jgi:hypothetical protein
MNTEQQLLKTWRQLPQPMQQEVLDFAEFLVERRSSRSAKPQPTVQPSVLGERLHAIRDQIVEAGMPLMTREEIEQEVLDRRGGYQE